MDLVYVNINMEALIKDYEKKIINMEEENIFKVMETFKKGNLKIIIKMDLEF